MLVQRKLSAATPARLLASVVGVFFLLILSSCGGSSTAVTPTPTPTHLTFTTLDLGLPAKALDAPVVGSLPDSTVLHVHVTFKTNQQVLNKLGQQKVQTGQSQNLEGAANQLGITDSEYQKIKSFFGVENATLKLNSLHTDLTIDAKASTFAKLLHTTFVYRKLNGRTFYAPATPPTVPTFVANAITAITGLDNYSLPPRSQIASMQTTAHQRVKATAADCNANPQAYTTPEIAQAYGYNRFWQHGWAGQHMTINLVEFGGLLQNDVDNYLSCVNFQGHISLKNIVAAPTTPSDESTLDVDMVAGMAPASNIVVYQTDSNTNNDFWVLLNDELQQILTDNTHNTLSGSVVSISYGGPENSISQNDMLMVDHTLQLLYQAEHMTIFVSSGDCGAFTDRTFGDLSVSFPASDPYATAVGGTELTTNSTGFRGLEAAWSDGSDTSQCTNQWGTGGGNSIVFKQPSYQAAPGVNNHFSQGTRQLPDISAIAFNINVYYQGQWQVVGGTSAASPIWASGMALVNQGLIQTARSFYVGTPVFYGLATTNTGTLHPFFDVTQGDNLFYQAGPGWDYTTGLGTPNLVDFYRVLLASAVKK